MRLIKNITLLCLLMASLSISAQLPFVYEVENTGDTCPKPPLPIPSELTDYAFLPDPFAWSDGSGRVDTFPQWECRRNEIKAEIENYEIGIKPKQPENISASYTGNTLTVTIVENGQTLTLTSSVFIPTGDGPFPIIIGMNNPTGNLPSELFTGVIQIPFMHNQVTTYNGYANSDPFFKLYPDQNTNNTGQYAAWSWGISRLIDGIELVNEQMNANTNQIAVTGCSYAGKMALFAGAFDERIALTIAQESGGGGINSWRICETIGEVEKLSNTNYDWFKNDLRTNFNNNVEALPYDHHELMAMCIPRALLVLGNPPYVWLGDESGYVSSRAAEEIYKTFGIEDRFGFSFRSGHEHCQLPSGSYPEVQAFVDRFLFNDITANTNIREHPFQTVNYKKWIETWSTPPNPNTPKVSIVFPETDTLMTAPATITAIAQVSDTNNDLEKVVFYSNDDEVETIYSEPFSCSFTNTLSGTYTIYAKAIDSTGLYSYSNSITITVRAPSYGIYKTSTPPIINGIIEDVWEDNQSTAFNAQNTLVGTELTATDLSGYSKVLWDDTYLYLLAVVTDETLKNDSYNTFEDDNVEFYFDGNNAKASSYDSDDVQLSFAWNDGTTIGTIPSNYSTSGITYSITDTDNGYIAEAQIPWSTLKITPENGKEIGFEFMINDDDDGGTRDGKVSWNAMEDNAWADASLFGTIKLDANYVIVGVSYNNMLPKIKIYPNPVQNELTIVGLNQEFSYQIYTTSGKLCSSGKIQKNIKINNLTKGIYILKLTGNNSVVNLKFIKN